MRPAHLQVPEVSESRVSRCATEEFSEVWSSEENERSLWLFFEVYALAMRNRKRFPGLLERLVKDWLPFFEHAVAASGVEAERVSPLATFILATIRGLQLDLLATGQRTRIDRAFREMLRLLSL